MFTTPSRLAWRIKVCRADTEFHNICKTHGINLAIVIGSTVESLKWIQQEVSRGRNVYLQGQDNFAPTT